MADKGKRNARHRQEMHIHADVDHALDEDEGGHTHHNQAAKVVPRHLRDAQQPPKHDEQQKKQQQGTHKTKFLSDDREDKIGVAHTQKA